MSMSKGNATRKRPQKHQNKSAFKNDLHDTSRKTKLLNSLEVTGVCARCKSIIEWKIKYKKYKPLTAPSKCVGCNEKTVKYAYHMLCSKCAAGKKSCAKCCKPVDTPEEVKNEEQIKNTEIQSILNSLPERKRRTLIRFINKTNGDTVSPNIISKIEDEMLKINKLNLSDDDDNFSSEELCESSDNDNSN